VETEPYLKSPLNFRGTHPILPVGGTAPGGVLWTYNAFNGTSEPSTDGVIAPAKSVISTLQAGSTMNYYDFARCGDSPGYDESGTRYSNGYGDAAGSCTGTSMSAPHVSALAGMVVSIHPRMTADQLRLIIQTSGNWVGARNNQYGYGQPNASSAVNAAIASNPSKLAPLFSLYSVARQDSFYTTVPQMANAALDGALRPRTWLGPAYTNDSHGPYASAYGTSISGYGAFPRNPFVIGGTGLTTPYAQVWVFTTHENPKSSVVSLDPIYRMSWKCGDATPYPPIVCFTYPKHIDTVHVNETEIGYFNWLGYKVDAIEGYVYPKSLPQPAGTVRLMRKYNAYRDDNAIFPDTAYSTMYSQGYTTDSNGTDWLGYVYPNLNGQTPVIQ
jgi:hypothetical protein